MIVLNIFFHIASNLFFITLDPEITHLHLQNYNLSIYTKKTEEVQKSSNFFFFFL